jgi:Tetratricopeptide repeat
MNSAWIRVSLACLAVALVFLYGCAAGPRERVQVPVPERETTPPTPPHQTPSTPETRAKTPPPVRPSPVTPPPPQVSAPPPLAPPPPRVSAPAPPPPSPAVVALLDTADKRASAGELDNAAAAVERALRLEPQNPLLWHRLAKLRLQQGQFAQAVSLAAKSNSLVRENRQLQASNWETIAQAQEKLGDVAAARAAREKARALQ